MAGDQKKKPPHVAEAEAALARARALLAHPGPLDEKTRAEVLSALDELSGAIAPVIEARPDEARSLSQFTEVVAHEATRPEPSPSLLRVGLDGMAQAAERLETRHPALAAITQRIADALAQIGI
jgi:hypothetical protein